MADAEMYIREMLPHETDHYTNMAILLFTNKLQELLKQSTKKGQKMILPRFNRAHKRAHYRMITKLNDINFDITKVEEHFK